VLSAEEIVFLLDVDNTLFDNDGFKDDLTERLTRDLGAAGNERYWAHYEALRQRSGYANYLGALQSLRADIPDAPGLARIADFMLDYPFAERLYPQALEAIAHLRTLGSVAVLSDGDIVFQPRKIRRSGIEDAVDGRVMICVHKQDSLPTMCQRFPARHYEMIDDKPLLLAAMKQAMGAELTSVFVRQGHYAVESAGTPIVPAPDRTIERIGDLCGMDLANFRIDATQSA
jgi:hypothetical protein